MMNAIKIFACCSKCGYIYEVTTTPGSEAVEPFLEKTIMGMFYRQVKSNAKPEDRSCICKLSCKVMGCNSDKPCRKTDSYKCAYCFMFKNGYCQGGSHV